MPMATIDIIIKAIDQASGAFDKVSKNAESVGKKMGQIGSTMTKNLTLPIVGLGAVMVKAYSDFDTQMTNFEARTGASAETMEIVRLKALELGRDTAFSASAAAEGMLELASSGYDVEQTLQAINPVLNLASAGMLELGHASDAVTDILAAFQLGVEDATYVTDVLAGASQKSSATVADLIEGFGNVGPVANNFGLSVEETAAALAVFSENAIKGSDGGTQLRSMLNNMSRQTNATQSAWRDLGTSMFDAQGQMKPLDQLIDDINRGMSGMTEQERINTIQALAGSYGQMGLSALLASDGIDTMVASMQDAQTAEEVANKQMESFAGAVNQLKSSFETMSIQVIGPFVEQVLKPMIFGITNVLNAYASWAAENQALSNMIVGLVAAIATIGPVLIIVSKLIAAFSMVKNAILAIKGAMVALNFVTMMNPWVAIIAAVAAGVLLLVTHWKEFKIGLEAVWTVLKGLVQLSLMGWIEMFKKASAGFSEFINRLKQGIEAWKEIPRLAYEIGKQIIQGLAKGINEGLKWIDNKLFGGVGQQVVGGIKKTFGIASPSKVMMGLGENVTEGFAKGIADGWAKTPQLSPLQASVKTGMQAIGSVPDAGKMQQRTISQNNGIAMNNNAGMQLAGAGGFGGNIIIEQMILPEGSTQDQAKSIMDIISKEMQRKNGLSGRSITR